MSNYLNNIVGRTLGVAAVVQPRLPQLFESSNYSESLAPDLSAEVEAQPRTNGESSAPIHEQIVTESNIAKSSGTIAQVDLESAQSPATIASVEVRPTVPLTFRTLDQLSEHLPLVSAERDDSSVHSTRDTYVPAPLSKQHKAAPHETQSQILPPPSPAQQFRKIRVETVRPVKRESSSVTRSALTSQPSIALPIVEQPPTAIKVTIGRVDVRAIMPPSVPSRTLPSRPKPALSLENYLKEREQGKR